jgi:hypothetical protein
MDIYLTFKGVVNGPRRTAAVFYSPTAGIAPLGISLIELKLLVYPRGYKHAEKASSYREPQ